MCCKELGVLHKCTVVLPPKKRHMHELNSIATNNHRSNFKCNYARWVALCSFHWVCLSSCPKIMTGFGPSLFIVNRHNETEVDGAHRSSIASTKGAACIILHHFDGILHIIPTKIILCHHTPTHTMAQVYRAPMRTEWRPSPSRNNTHHGCPTEYAQQAIIA